MNELDELIKVGDEINNRLTQIRKRINAPLGNFTVAPKDIEIKERTGEELTKGRERGDPIMNKGKFYLVYIKDNLYHNKDDHDRSVDNSTSGCFIVGKKLHFYCCKIIYDMTKTGRKRRYVATSYFSNVQPIDLCGAEGFEARLALCKYCIGDLITNGEVDIPYYENIIAEYGNAQTLMHCVKLLHNKDSDAKRKTKEFISRTLRKANA